jgi:FAD synthetase
MAFSPRGEFMENKKPKKVMAFGTIDMLHRGHEHFLREARKLGGELVVVVARDRTVEAVKGRKVVDDENTRKRRIEETGIADRVVLGSLGDKYGVVRKERPDVICLGYDQSSFVDGLSEFLKSDGIHAKIFRLGAHRPDVFKTSIIRKSRKRKEAASKRTRLSD